MKTRAKYSRIFAGFRFKADVYRQSGKQRISNTRLCRTGSTPGACHPDMEKGLQHHVLQAFALPLPMRLDQTPGSLKCSTLSNSMLYIPPLTISALRM